jgi:bifunctional non-homologous end joining protein LigD
MALDAYRRKRDFRKTPEPDGHAHGSRGKPKPILVVQKHAARRLHYDFRLEINGVLVSWAVPKGPSLNPSDRRLAIRTEDHPLEYADFEGVIPEGQYGAGTVMVWDKGTYEVENGLAIEQQLARGEIKVILHGKKLRGGFVSIQTVKRLAARAEQARWLLIKQRDQYADPSWNIESPALDYSVLSGAAMQEIKEEHLVQKR